MSRKLSISEVFTSPQGEGFFSGVAMTFIRLAGCSVGKKLTPEMRQYWREKEPNFGNGLDGSQDQLPIIQEYTELCHTVDGRPFLCDTDFRPKEYRTPEELLDMIPPGVHHVCITGGEPLIHKLDELFLALRCDGKQIHIETSGTVDSLNEDLDRPYLALEEVVQTIDHSGLVWMTVAPKIGALPKVMKCASQIKLLVDADFDPAKLPIEILNHKLVYLMPINEEHTANFENAQLCLEWQQKFPHWRIGNQLHKFLGCR